MRSRAASIPELLDVFVVGSRQQIEEGIEAAIERPAKLRDGAVERMKRQAGRRAIGEFQCRFLDSSQRAFRNEPNTVDQGISSHAGIVQAVRWGPPSGGPTGPAKA